MLLSGFIGFCLLEGLLDLITTQASKNSVYILSGLLTPYLCRHLSSTESEMKQNWLIPEIDEQPDYTLRLDSKVYSYQLFEDNVS